MTDRTARLDDDIVRTVERALAEGSYTPPLLPQIAVELATLAAQPDIDPRAVERALIDDPQLAGRVVSAANSAGSAPATPVTGLYASICRLGVRYVRDVVFHAVLTTRLFRVPGYTERITHVFHVSHVAGLLARRYCERAELDADAAYLSGLVRDIGHAAIYSIVAEHSRRSLAPLPSTDCLSVLIAARHADLAAQMCATWKLPAPVGWAAEHHHIPHDDHRCLGVVRALVVAERLLAHAGVGSPPSPVAPGDYSWMAQELPDTVALSDLIRYAELLAEPANDSSITRRI